MLVFILQLVFGASPPPGVPSAERAPHAVIQSVSFQATITSVTVPPVKPPAWLNSGEISVSGVDADDFEELEEIFELEEIVLEKPSGPIRTFFLGHLRAGQPLDECPVSGTPLLARNSLLVNGESETRVIEVPKNVLSVMMGPVREANLLLPKRLDPFSESTLAIDTDELVAEGEAPREQSREPFNIAKQRELLGMSLASRQNVPEQDAKWQLFAEAGGSFRQGNTSNTNIHSMLRSERHSINADIMGRVGVTYNRNGDDDTNRNILGEALIDRNLRGRWVVYGRENLEYDEARLINIRTVTSSGLGFKFINQLTSRLIVRTGPTISYISYAPSADTAANMRSGWLLESDYRRLLGESARVEWTCSAFPDFASEQEFRIRNEAALLFPIGGKLSPWKWKLGARHDYQVNPVDNTRASDIEGYFSIAYSK